MAASPSEHLRVVVVDDMEDMRAILSIFADMEGFEVVGIFANVAAAMQFSGWRDVDAALIDWMMPTQDGGTLVEWLARMHPHVKRVVATNRQELPRHPLSDVELFKTDLDSVMRSLRGV